MRPYLSPRQHAAYLAVWLRTLPAGRLLAALGHALLAAYLAGLAMVLAWSGHALLAAAGLAPGQAQQQLHCLLCTAGV
jgi:hypothetical protein